MKQVTIFILLAALVTACKKDQPLLQKNQNEKYLNRVVRCLKDSLTDKDFMSVDFGHFSLSEDSQNNSIIIRLGMKGASIENDFILVQTNTDTVITKGSIVHIEEEKTNGNERFIITISSLGRQTSYVLKESTKRGGAPNQRAPTDTHDLPEVVVTAYSRGGISTRWYFYAALLGYGGSGAGYNGSNMYGSASYGGHRGGGGTPTDKTIIIETESTAYPAINLQQYLKCFNYVSNTNATYTISILTDLPVNGDPDKLFDWRTLSPGHTFLRFRKTNGNESVQQSIGFYPQVGWKAIEASAPVASKFVDNQGHEFNASLTIVVAEDKFKRALNEVAYLSTMRYDIDNFNCTDFSLAVFNAASSEPLFIPKYHLPGSMYGEVSNTPQGLYNELVTLKSVGTYPGEIEIPGICGYVGSSHGPCQ